ncbi:hypothetical protein [Natronobacterium haloterrestre]|uniref:hypothetical protein n=1 Tax=Natronobacterium haloterrestre TaxID=148448 RepID=UPI001FE20847|nr:hypothetical protein [Halobiforma haloterrestris]
MSGLRRLLLLAAGSVAVAYLVSRYVSDRAVPSVDEVRDRAPSAEELREQTADAVSDEFRPIPIGDRGENEGRAQEKTEDTDGTDPIDDVETSIDVTDGERSPEEIAERADEEVPEPGEMAVDEEVAEELIDDEDDLEGANEGEQESDGDEEEGDEQGRNE